MRGLFFITAIFITSLILLTAQVPQLINYQGFLKESNGQPTDGTVNLVFRIFDAKQSGSQLWSETHSNVEVKSGVFNVLLGGITSFSQNVFRESGERFLEIAVNSNTLSERFKITSVAYAIRAECADNVADNAVSSATIQNGEIRRVDIASGQVVRSLNAMTDDIRIGAGANVFITQSGDTIKISAQTGTGEVADGSITEAKLANNAVTSIKILDGTIIGNDIANNTITSNKIAPDEVVEEINNLRGNINLQAGNNITITTPNDTTINIAATAGGSGDITAVNAGSYLTGGGTTGDVTLSLSIAATDTVYVNHGETNSIINGMIQNNAVTSAKILDGTIGTGDLGNDIITTAKIPSREIQEEDLDDDIVSSGKIQNNAITAAKIIDEPGIVYKQVNGLFSLVNTGYTYAIDSISFTAPANGFIVAGSNGYVNINHGTTVDNICFEVKNSYDSGDALFGAGCSSFLVPSALPVTMYRDSFYTRKVFSVTSGSITHIYLLVRQFSGSNPTDTAVYDYNIIATFYPTQY
jgi:hypothetical protein